MTRDWELQRSYWIWKLGYWRPWEAEENLALCLQKAGDTDRAVKLMNGVFDKNDQWVRDNNGLLDSRLRTARVGWRLVEILDPEIPTQAVRRWEVLKRVDELLDGPENKSRFTPYEHEIKEEISQIL